MVIVRNNKDADAACIIMAAVPRDKMGLAKGVKKLGTVEVTPNEILRLVDSGGFVHAIDADVEITDHTIRENDPKGETYVMSDSMWWYPRTVGHSPSPRRSG